MKQKIYLMKQLIIHWILILGLVAMIAPFLWMLSTSFKTTKATFHFPPDWIPNNPTIAHYVELFKTLNFLVPFKNTVIVAFTITILSILIASMAGYAFAKFKFPGRDKLFFGLLGTLMIPGQITMIPVFLLLKELGFLNSYQGLILPGLASAFNIFFMRQFIKTIPDELLEIARIDGASELYIFFKIVLPLSKPALAALGIFNFTGSWNSFLWPLIIATDENMYTLPVAIANLEGQFQTEYGLQMAGAVVVILPIIIVFLFLQKYFIQGITLSGLKG